MNLRDERLREAQRAALRVLATERLEVAAHERQLALDQRARLVRVRIAGALQITYQRRARTPRRGQPSRSPQRPPHIRENCLARVVGKRHERRVELVRIGRDHRLGERALRLEVVVDVAHREPGALGDVGDRRALDALLVEGQARGLHQRGAVLRSDCAPAHAPLLSTPLDTRASIGRAG